MTKNNITTTTNNNDNDDNDDDGANNHNKCSETGGLPFPSILLKTHNFHSNYPNTSQLFTSIEDPFPASQVHAAPALEAPPDGPRAPRVGHRSSAITPLLNYIYIYIYYVYIYIYIYIHVCKPIHI